MANDNKKNNFDKIINIVSKKKRELIRRRITQPKQKALYSELALNDKVENLIPYQTIQRDIFKIDQSLLTKGRVSIDPWSDDYWPYTKEY